MPLPDTRGSRSHRGGTYACFYSLGHAIAIIHKGTFLQTEQSGKLENIALTTQSCSYCI